MQTLAFRAAALACVMAFASAFSPAVVGTLRVALPVRCPMAAAARRSRRTIDTKMDMGVANTIAGFPLIYALLSANEFVTHKYYQHNEVDKLEFYQTLRKNDQLPKFWKFGKGGGHIAHHAETYDDMALKTDNAVWMASSPAQQLSGDKYRGTAFMWRDTRDMCIQCIPTVLPAFALLGWSLPATLALWLPSMALHGLVWNSLHPHMHSLPDVPASEGLPSSLLKGLRGSPIFEWLRLNHAGHHVASGRANYNVCLPGMDHILGTHTPVEEWAPMVREREILEAAAEARVVSAII